MKLIALLALSLLPLTASERSPYFQIDGDHRQDLFPLKSSHAEVTITGPIAEVLLTQTYSNLGSRPINATYYFPASTKAAVHGMTMTIGERTVKAVIHKKEEARQKFEKAKKEKKSASLLEQKRPNIFSMDVAQVLPGDEIKLALRYSEILMPVDGEYEFVVPTAIGPRYGEAPGEVVTGKNPYLNEGERTVTRFSTRVNIKSALPIQSLACRTHQAAQLKFTSKTNATLTLPPVQPDRDFIVNYRLAEERIQTGLMTDQEGAENTFLIQMEPPVKVSEDQIPPRDFVFVVDVSGSMSGFPLNLAKSVFRELTQTLRPTDRFNVVLFAGASEMLAKESLPVTSDHIEKAIRFLNGSRGGGGTELRRALKRALDLPHDRDTARSLVLITDGFISAESEVFDLIREDSSGTTIFPLGIGSSVNRHLIEGLSRVAGNDEFIVTHPSETSKVKDRFLNVISTPVLTHIRLEGDGVELSEIEPASRSDLFANRPLSLVGKWSGAPGGAIILKATQGDGTTLTRRFEIIPAERNPSLPVLWARERVKSLADYASLTKKSSIVDEVTQLGLKYQLLTPFTSFVAILEEPRKDLGMAKQVTQAKPLPLGVSQKAQFGGVTAGSVPEPSASLLLLLGAGLLASLRIRS